MPIADQMEYMLFQLDVSKIKLNKKMIFLKRKGYFGDNSPENSLTRTYSR